MKFLALSLLLGLSCGSSAQTALKSGGFKMTIPKGWHVRTNDEVIDNLDRYKLTAEQRTKLIASHQGSVLVRSCQKYLPSEHAGPIPTANVLLRSSITQDPKAFLAWMDKSARGMSANLENYKIIDAPRLEKVDGRDAVMFRATFTMKSPAGNTYDVRSTTYAIMAGDVFYQLSMSDGSGEDCSGLYTEMIRSIDLD